MNAEFQTLHDCLRSHVQKSPDKELFTFLDEHGEKSDGLTYAELDRRARAIAAKIQARGSKRQRVLLLFSPGLDFAAAFYACVYAGAVAVPAYPPEPANITRTLPRLQAIVANASPSLVLTSAALLAMAKQLFAFAPDLANLEWMAVDETSIGSDISAYQAPELLPDDLALIQYTSGSTARPKGVMVSHRNLMTNMRMFQQVGHHDESRTILSWLPTYHDLGLMSGIILPVGAGTRTFLLSPLDFLKSPAIWLTSIHRYRATDTCAPNFALDLAVRKTSMEERQGLDLSCVKLCLVGAETVRHASVERFLHAFEKHGLSRLTILPGYGLAEAVVGVSCGPLGEPWRATFIAAPALEENRFAEVSHADPKALPLVACGAACDGVTLEIVNPETFQLAGSDEIGEIWMEGANVAMGYWGMPKEESDRTFKARITDQPGREMLRTGDMGFLKEGQLYITGRIKDLIIIRGRNYYPQDIELTVELCHPRIRPGAVIAFSIEREGVECLVVVAEFDPRQLHTDMDKQKVHGEIVDAIRLSVSASHSLQIHGVMLVKVKTIDKTSSGKLARQASRSRYLKNKLDKEFSWTIGERSSTEQPTIAAGFSKDNERHDRVLSRQSLRQLSPLERNDYVANYLANEIRGVVSGMDQIDLSSETQLAVLGMDSISAADLAAGIQKDLQVDISVLDFLGTTSFGELVEKIAVAVAHDGVSENQTSRKRFAQAVVLKEITSLAPLFCVGGLFGTVSYLLPFSKTLGQTQPVIAFQAPGIDGYDVPLGSVEEMASRYIKEMKSIQPSGPYTLAGHSFGGLVAYEMAQRLAEKGDSVRHLFLLDTTAIRESEPVEESQELMALYELMFIFRRLSGEPEEATALDKLASLGPDEQRSEIIRELNGGDATLRAGSALDHMVRVHIASFLAMMRYRLVSYAGPITLVRAEQAFPIEAMHPARRFKTYFGEPYLGWNYLCPQLAVVPTPGDHFSMLLPPHVEILGDELSKIISDQPRMDIDLDRISQTHIDHVMGSVMSVSKEGISFNPNHPDYYENPYPFWHQMREHDPVYWHANSSEYLSSWWLTRYADVSTCLRDKRFLVDSRDIVNRDKELEETHYNGDKTLPLFDWLRRKKGTAVADFFNHAILTINPPDHQRLRQCFAPLFDPSTIQRWAPAINVRVNDLIAEMRLRRDPDIIRDLALPLPTGVVALMLGIPAQDIFLLEAWGREAFRALVPMRSIDDAQRIEKSASDFLQYMHEHVESRRKSSAQDDFLGHLLNLMGDGKRLTIDELVANCMLLFIAGFETTTSMIGNGTLALLRNPDQFRLLREHPELAGNAVDELLRYDGALRMTLRTALEDVELGGKCIRRGDVVAVVLAAANRDPAVFPNPDKLDLTRSAKNHVAFAQGIHYCLGASLAKIELQSAMRALVRHNFSLVPEKKDWRQSVVFRRLEKLRVVFNE